MNIEELPRPEIERQLEQMLACRDASDDDYIHLGGILGKLKKAPKRAYTLIEKLIEAQHDWINLHEWDKHILPDAPLLAYDFLIERIEKSEHPNLVRDTSEALGILLKNQKVIDMTYRLFTGEQKRDVGFEEVMGVVRTRFDDEWLARGRYDRETLEKDPDFNFARIIQNLEGMHDYSDELFDFIAKNNETWYPYDVLPATVGLIESEGVNSNSIALIEKLSERNPENMQLVCRGLIPLDASPKFYRSLNTWIDAGWHDFDICDVSKWIVHYEPKWVKELDGHGWLKVPRGDEEQVQPMRDLFYYFFTGKRKEASIDDILNVASENAKDWHVHYYSHLTYYFSYIADLPEVWGFVRNETFKHGIDIYKQLPTLFKTAQVLALSPEARSAVFEYYNAEHRTVTLEEALVCIEDKKWDDKDLDDVLGPYASFISSGVAQACYLIPNYEKSGLERKEIIAVGRALEELPQPCSDFYSLIEGMKAKEVEHFVAIYNSFPELSQKKRLEVLGYLKSHDGESLFKHAWFFRDNRYSHFNEWRKQLSYFEDATSIESIGTRGLIDLLSSTQSLSLKLMYIMEMGQLIDLTIDETQGLEDNYNLFMTRIGELAQRFSDFDGYNTESLNNAYNVLDCFSSETRLAILGSVRDNPGAISAIAHLNYLEEHNKPLAAWKKQFSYFDNSSITTPEVTALLTPLYDLYSALASIHEESRLLDLTVCKDLDVRTNYNIFRSTLEGLCETYHDLIHNENKSDLRQACSSLRDFDSETRLNVVGYLAENPKDLKAVASLDARSAIFSDFRQQLAKFGPVAEIQDIGVAGLVDLISTVATVFPVLRSINEYSQLSDIPVDKEADLKANYHLVMGEANELAKKYRCLVGESNKDLRDIYRDLAGFSPEKRLEIINHLSHDPKRKHFRIYHRIDEQMLEWRQSLAYFEAATEIHDVGLGKLVDLLSMASSLSQTLNCIGEEAYLYNLTVDQSQDLRDNHQRFVAQLGELSERYQDLLGSDNSRLRHAYMALKGFERDKKLDIIRNIKDSPNVVSSVLNFYQSKDYPEWKSESAAIDLDTESLVLLLSRACQAYTVLKTHSQENKLFEESLRQTGNNPQDQRAFMNRANDAVYDLVEKLVAEPIDRKKLEINDELFEILGNFNKNNQELLRPILSDYINGDSNLTPAEISKIASLNVSENTKSPIIHLIADYQRGIPVEKSFPTGKEYCRQPVKGMKERRSPTEMTDLLVRGLISNRPESIEMAGRKFDFELLASARSHIRRVEVYHHIQEDLQRLRMGDEDSAKRILSYLISRYGNVEPVTDIVDGVQGLFLGQETFDYVSCRFQPGQVFDMLGSSRMMCCTFQPSSSESALLYLLDEEIGLLHLTPVVNDSYIDPIGAGILANCRDSQGTKVLLVDSVEGGFQIDRLRENMWKGMMHNGIDGVARDVGASLIVVNTRVAGVKPKKFVNYVASQGYQPAQIHLEKMGGNGVAESYGITKTGLEAFNGGTKGKVTGLVIPVR